MPARPQGPHAYTGFGGLDINSIPHSKHHPSCLDCVAAKGCTTCTTCATFTTCRRAAGGAVKMDNDTSNAVSAHRACRFGPGVWQHGQALGGGHQAQQVTAAAVPGSLPALDASIAGVARPLPRGAAAVTGEACAGRSLGCPGNAVFGHNNLACSSAHIHCWSLKL